MELHTQLIKLYWDDAMKNEILLFLTRPICYESNHYFVYAMQEAFEKLGHKVRVMDLEDISCREKNLEGIIGQSFAAMIDFNSILPKLKMDDGTYFLDQVDAPFYDYIVDHPLYHHPVLEQKLHDFHVICLDAYHKKYIEDYYPWIRSVHQMPLGGMMAGGGIPFEKRRYPLVFLATHTSSEQVMERISQISGGLQKEVSAVLSLLLEDRSRTQEEALAALCGQLGAEPSKAQFREMMNLHFLADMYLRAREREAVVRTILTEGYPLYIFGHGWNAFQKKEPHAKSLIPMPAVSFPVSLEVMTNANICLNINPRFHGGAHDRIFSAMANGAAVLTDASEYLWKQFGHREHLMVYDMKQITGGTVSKNWEKQGEDICALLEEMFQKPDITKELARRGKEEAWKKHLWIHRLKPGR